MPQAGSVAHSRPRAVDWPNACISAPSYRRDSAACSTFTRPSLAGTCPGEVGHDDAANPIAAARPIAASSLAIFLASVPPCGGGIGYT